MASTRLPGKVLAELAGRPVLEQMIRRVKRSTTIDSIIVATTTNEKDNPIETLCSSLRVNVYRGSETDVLLRYLGAARDGGAHAIVRLTADCPMIDPELVDQIDNISNAHKANTETLNKFVWNLALITRNFFFRGL